MKKEFTLQELQSARYKLLDAQKLLIKDKGKTLSVDDMTIYNNIDSAWQILNRMMVLIEE